MSGSNNVRFILLQIILGWFGDMKINVTILYAFCMIFCGIIVFMVPSFVAFEVSLFEGCCG